MKVLLINGSPKAKGCTYTALKEVSDTLEKNGVETEIIHIGGKVKGGCKGCGACYSACKGKCIQDDIVNEVLDKVASADGYVFGSPVHYASASGDLTSFMDRLFYVANSLMAFKPAAAVESCRRGGTTATFDQINKYFTISNMPVVSSNYWNSVHGNTPEEVLQDLEGLQVMRGIGNNMAWLLKCIELGKANGINKPEPEDKIRTNFIR